MAGIECVINKKSKDPLLLDKAIGARIDEESLKLGLIIRPIYHICVLSPALIIQKAQIDDLVWSPTILVWASWSRFLLIRKTLGERGR